MSVLVAALLMQYVISTKAGLVNHVEGSANIREMETARPGSPIRTFSDGYVEVLLRPGSFLRLGENSEAVLDDVDLSSIKVTVSRGPALIEVDELNKDYPITVTTGNLTTRIIETGIYKFENGTATVLQGKLQTTGTKLTYVKGWEIFYKDNYRARKTGKIQETALDVFSQTRSGAIAAANFSLASSLNGPGAYSDFDIWLYSPYIRMYTYMPRSDFRSPYGYRFYGVTSRPVRQVASENSSNEPSGGASNAPSNNTSNSGGTAAAAPAPTANTPSGERSAPAVYIESKSSTVGATTR